MPLVIDASIAASWFFEDESDPTADRALTSVQQDGAIVPIHWWFELRNAFVVGERRRRVDWDQTARALAFVEQLPIEFLPFGDDAAIFALARRYRLTFYDSAYLEAARRVDLALATLDRDLAEAARREGVPLFGTP